MLGYEKRCGRVYGVSVEGVEKCVGVRGDNGEVKGVWAGVGKERSRGLKKCGGGVEECME